MKDYQQAVDEHNQLQIKLTAASMKTNACRDLYLVACINNAPNKDQLRLDAVAAFEAELDTRAGGVEWSVQAATQQR